MIYLNLNLRNPWGKDFKSLYVAAGDTPFKHKFWEIQVIENDNWLRFEFEFTIRQDHAGLNLELGLFGYEIHVTLYDNRHWNWEEGRWMIYDEEKGLH
jgi:hypothetical protein